MTKEELDRVVKAIAEHKGWKASSFQADEIFAEMMRETVLMTIRGLEMAGFSIKKTAGTE